MSENPIDRAAKAIGGTAEFMARFGIARRTFFNWRDRVPAERAVEIERATGVPRHELRPDLWEAPAVTGASA